MNSPTVRTWQPRQDLCNRRGQHTELGFCCYQNPLTVLCCLGENMIVGSEAPNEQREKEEEENGGEKEEDKDAEKQESGENYQRFNRNTQRELFYSFWIQ